MNHHQVDRLVRHDSEVSLHTLMTSAANVADLAVALNNESMGKVAARVVRGKKCRTSPDLFNEFAAAWQFPPYFGENWNALDECLGDLQWIPAESYVLLITDAPLLLHDEKPEVLRHFLETLDGVTRGWSTVSFHVVFQSEESGTARLTERLKHSSVKFDEL